MAEIECPNLFSLARSYVDRLITTEFAMKVLLLDASTVNYLSVVFSQTELLQRGVFLVSTVDTRRTPMPSMKCIIFVRPSSVSDVCVELQRGWYQDYALFFSNVVPTDELDRLARSDVHEKVTHVEECFFDWTVLNRDFLLIDGAQPPLPPSLVPSTHGVEAIAQRLAGLMVALRRKPVVRFQSSSVSAKRVAKALQRIVSGDAELFDYKPRDTLMLLVDRAEDPVTPLLTPWTYQSMLHNLIGLRLNQLKIPSESETNANIERTDETTADEHELGYTFSPCDDTFFARTMYQNWGELCLSVKGYVDECKTILHIDRSTATMEELKQFMANLPKTKHMTGSVTKHANATSYLSNTIKKRNLLDISLLEQDMAASSNPNEHWARLLRLAQAASMNEEDRLRLALLYHLRYEKGWRGPENSGSKVAELLSTHSRSELLRKLRDYFGNDAPTGLLFPSSQNVVASVVSFVKGLSDEKNLYTQRDPLLKKTILTAAQGKLDPAAYTYPGESLPGAAVAQSMPVKELIVVMLGGATYDEAAVVHHVNSGWPGEKGKMPEVAVTLVGTALLNSSDFLRQLERCGPS